MLSRKKRPHRKKRGQSDRLYSVFSKDFLNVTKWSKNLVENKPGKACGARLWRVWVPGR